MTVFAMNVLPVLFPFFFITGLLVELDLFKHKKLQKVGIVSLSFLAGSPTSSRILSQLYTRGEISRGEAIRTATYTSTTSSIFIIATLGSALYGDVRIGIVIFAAHILGAVVNGVLFIHIPSSLRAKRSNPKFISHPHPSKEGNNNTIEIGEAVSRALNSAVSNIFAVGGLVVVFFIVSHGLPIAAAGVLEMTTGVFRAEAVTQGFWRAIIACAIVSFGGLCVAMQSFVFLRTFEMPVWFYFLYKTTHTIFSVAICAGLLLVFQI